MEAVRRLLNNSSERLHILIPKLQCQRIPDNDEIQARMVISKDFLEVGSTRHLTDELCWNKEKRRQRGCWVF